MSDASDVARSVTDLLVASPQQGEWYQINYTCDLLVANSQQGEWHEIHWNPTLNREMC